MSEWMNDSVDHSALASEFFLSLYERDKGLSLSPSTYMENLWSMVPCISIFSNIDVIMSTIKSVALILEF